MFTRSEAIGLAGLAMSILAAVLTVVLFVLQALPGTPGENLWLERSLPVLYFSLGGVCAYGLILINQRRRFLYAPPMIITPMEAKDYEVELWAKKSNSFFQSSQFFIPVEVYRSLQRKTPRSFRVFRAHASGELVGGYLLLFVNGLNADKFLRGELFMVDVNEDTICDATVATLLLVCDLVITRNAKRSTDLIVFDLLEQIIATAKSLPDISYVAAYSIDKSYERLLAQMGFTERPLPTVARTGRKLWIAPAQSFRNMNWSIDYHV